MTVYQLPLTEQVFKNGDYDYIPAPSQPQNKCFRKGIMTIYLLPLTEHAFQKSDYDCIGLLVSLTEHVFQTESYSDYIPAPAHRTRVLEK